MDSFCGKEMEIKNQLQFFLKARNLTAAELSRISGIPKQSLSDWLAGVKPRSITHVKKLADVFGISLDEFLSHKEQEKPKQKKHSYPQNPLGAITFIMDLQGRLVEGNEGMLNLLGITKEKATSVLPIDIIHYSDSERVNRYRKVLVESGSSDESYDFRVFDSIGKVKWIRVHTAFMLGAGYIQELAEDVTAKYPRETPERYETSLHILLEWLERQFLNANNYGAGPVPADRVLFTISEPEGFTMEFDAAQRNFLSRLFQSAFKSAQESQSEVQVLVREGDGSPQLEIRFPKLVPKENLPRPYRENGFALKAVDERTLILTLPSRQA